MIESIKREHLVREGVIRSFNKKFNTNQKAEDLGNTITSNKRPLTKDGFNSNR